MSDSNQDPTRQAYEDPEVISGYIKRNQLSEKQVEMINKFAELVGKGRILDLGCGPGRDAQVFSRIGLQVVGLDYSAEMLRRASQLDYDGLKPEFVQASMLDLASTFAENSFDGIWASASLLHIKKEDADSVLSGIQSVARDGAIVMISLKAGEGTKMVEDDKYWKKVKREFTFWQRQEFLDRVARYGFELIEYREQESYAKVNPQQMQWHVFFFKIRK